MQETSDIHSQIRIQKNLTAWIMVALKVCTEWTRRLLLCFCILLRAQKPLHWDKFDIESLPVTLARSCTTCSTRTLVGISLADGKNLQSIHSNTWIENLLG